MAFTTSVVFTALQSLAAIAPFVNRFLSSRYFTHYRRVSRETYNSFITRRAYHESIDRDQGAREFIDSIASMIEDRIHGNEDSEKEAVLLVGKAGIGKSQMVIDIAAFLNCRLLYPKREVLKDLAASSWMKWAKKDGCILFLDDLPQLMTGLDDSHVLSQIIGRFIAQRGSVVATCRSEVYRQVVAAKLGEGIFRKLEVPEWTDDEGSKLSTALGKPFEASGFDGTPLSITMGFTQQRDIYQSLGQDAKGMLRSIKLLYLAGLLSKEVQPTREILRRTATDIMGVIDPHSGLTRIIECGLAYVDNQSVFAYEGTLENVISDFPTDESEQWNLIGRLPQVLLNRAESTIAFAAGLTSYYAGHIDLADRFWTRAIELDPTNARAYSNRGVTREGTGDPKGAIADHDKAIELDPSLAQAYYNRGVARGKTGDPGGEIADYNKAIELDPSLAQAYYNRGVARGKTGDPGGAIADFDKAIELDPSDAKAYSNRGVVRRKTGDPKGAIADFDKTIELDPSDATAYSNRGAVRAETGDPKGAIADFDKAIELDPSLAQAYYNRGVVRGKVGDPRGEIADFDKAIELDPSYAKAYHNRGVARGKTGDPEGAIADKARAAELDLSVTD